MVAERWFVSITAGRWQASGILAAKKMGLKVIGVDADKSAGALALCDHVIVADIFDVDLILRSLRDLGKNYVGAASFCSEAGMRTAACVREEFGLRGPTRELTERLVSKEKQRTCWAKENLPNPEWAVHRDFQNALEWCKKLSGELIIKPVDSSGSRGVSVVDSSSGDCGMAIEKALDYSKSKSLIIERFVRGVEYAIDSFSQGGEFLALTVSQKVKVDKTSDTVASEYHSPECGSRVLAEIKRVVERAYQAIGYMDGPGHAEVIVDGNGKIFLVEVAGRGGGFSVFDNYVPKLSGFDLPTACVKNLIGQSIQVSSSGQKPAVLRFFPSQTGTLIKKEGIEEANKIENVEVVCFAEIGKEYGVATTDGDRLGYIFSRGETLEEARQRAAQAEELVRFGFE